MKKAKWIPFAALVGGLIGLVARQYYLRTSLELDTGLPITGTTSEAVQWVLCLVVALVLLFLSSGKHQDFGKRYAAAYTPPNFLNRTLMLAGAFLFLVAAVLNVKGFLEGTVDALGQRSVGVMHLFLAAVALMAGLVIIAITMSLSNGREPKRVLLPLPGFVGCVWVMANSQEWARRAITANYYLELLAVLVAMVACTLLVVCGFGKGKVGGTLFFAGEGAAFCIMILGDGLPLYDLALTLGMAFYLLAMSQALAHNDGIPLPPLPEEDPPPSCDSSACANCPSAAPDGSCASGPQNGREDAGPPQNGEEPSGVPQGEG